MPPFSLWGFSLQKTINRHIQLTYFTKSQLNTPILNALPIMKIKEETVMTRISLKVKTVEVEV